MSDPIDRSGNRNAELNPQPLPPEEKRKGVSPLIWILVLIALAALAWWFYNRNVQTGVDTSAPVATEPAITSEQEAAATAERERAQANERAREERKRAASAPARPADREVAALDKPRPTYPPAAFRAGEEGTVVVRVDVDASGNPTSASVETSSRSRDLDRAAVEAVKKWRFEPAIKDGKPVASAANVPVEFKLDQQ